MIFISSPYSHQEQLVRQKRYEAVSNYAAKLIKDGEVAFSPITYGHIIVEFDNTLPTDWLFWEKFCFDFLRYSASMHVLMLDGWEASKGVDTEITMAKLLNIPITYVMPR